MPRILAWGLNATRTLDPSPSSPAFFPEPTDITPSLPGVVRIAWTSWGATVGETQDAGYVIWGLSPLPGFPEGFTDEPVPLELAGTTRVVIRSFFGRETLEGAVLEDGRRWVAGSSLKDKDEMTGWRDIAVLGDGSWFGLHDCDLTRPLTARSLSQLSPDLCLPIHPSSSSLDNKTPVHPPTFDRLYPGSSHVLLATPPDASHFIRHPPHAAGSNLRSQLNLPVSSLSPSTNTSTHLPHLHPLADLFSGLPTGPYPLSLQASGPHSSAILNGELYVWGGVYGVSSGPINDELPPLHPRTSEGEEDNDLSPPPQVRLAAVAGAPSGAMVCVLEDGRILASRGADGEGLRPLERPELEGRKRTRREEEVEEEEWTMLHEKGGKRIDGRRVRQVVVASGGRGFFLVLDDEAA